MAVYEPDILGQWPLGTLGSQGKRIMDSERRRLLIEAAQPLRGIRQPLPAMRDPPSSCSPGFSKSPFPAVRGNSWLLSGGQDRNI